MWFDLRFVGDRYYDPEWAREILDRRVWNPGGFFTPSNEDYFESLAYHAVVHKNVFSRTYSQGNTWNDSPKWRAPLDALLGGDAAANAAIIEGIISGDEGPRRDVVLLNAAAALRLCGRVATLGEGVRAASTAIDSGGALETLLRLSQVSRGSVSAEAR